MSAKYICKLAEDRYEGGGCQCECSDDPVKLVESVEVRGDRWQGCCNDGEIQAGDEECRRETEQELPSVSAGATLFFFALWAELRGFFASRFGRLLDAGFGA